MRRLTFLLITGLLLVSSSFTSFLTKNTDYKPGTVLVSIDNGKLWQNIGEDLPDDIRVASIAQLKSSFYLGTNKGLYKTNYIFPKVNWNAERGFDKEVMSFYPQNEKLLFTTNWFGLNEYTPNKGLFSKITDDKHIGLISSVVKISESLIYYSSEYGLYKTTDSGKQWKKVYNNAIIKDMIKTNDNLIIAGKFGIKNSDLNAQQWEQKLTTDCTITNLIQEGNEIYAIGVYENQFMHINNAVYQSLDQGKSWQKLNLSSKLSSINQILKTKDYYFISSEEGIFRSKKLEGEWEQVQAKPSSKFGYHKLFYFNNYLFCIYAEPNC